MENEKEQVVLDSDVSRTDVNSTDINENSEPTETPKKEEMQDYLREDFFKQKEALRKERELKAALKAELDELREAKAKKEGNLQELYETLKKEHQKTLENIKLSEKEKKYEAFKKTVGKKAAEMGFTKDADKVLGLLSEKDKKLLVMDGDYTVDEYGLEKALTNVKKDWGELFKPKKIDIADGQIKTNINTPVKKAERPALHL